MSMRLFAVAVLPFLALSSAAAAPPAGFSAVPLPEWQSAAPQQVSTSAVPVLLTPAQVETLLPATVYYLGKNAPIQLRNAAGARFGADGYVLAAMVDTSGYASSVQETYQFYFITERALMIGGQHVSPGAYGAGVVNGKLSLMDVGGHVLLHADTTLDEAMARPRPLQLVLNPAGGMKLYLGRNWITITAATL